MNHKLFGAIVLVGISLGVEACRTQPFTPRGDGSTHDLGSSRDLARVDLAIADQATPVDIGLVDLSGRDLPICCADPGVDLSACIPINCILV